MRRVAQPGERGRAGARDERRTVEAALQRGRVTRGAEMTNAALAVPIVDPAAGPETIVVSGRRCRRPSTARGRDGSVAAKNSVRRAGQRGRITDAGPGSTSPTSPVPSAVPSRPAARTVFASRRRRTAPKVRGGLLEAEDAGRFRSPTKVVSTPVPSEVQALGRARSLATKNKVPATSVISSGSLLVAREGVLGRPCPPRCRRCPPARRLRRTRPL